MIFLLMWFGRKSDCFKYHRAASCPQRQTPNKAQQSAKTRMQRVSSATEHVESTPSRLKCEDGRGQGFGAGNRVAVNVRPKLLHCAQPLVDVFARPILSQTVTFLDLAF